jgi:SAM-dependent methyltransferase
MSATEIETMRSVEDELWWYRALREHVLNSIAPAPHAFELLDAGCGSGGMLARVRKRFPDARLTGLDWSERALELTAGRDLRATLVRGSTDELPFRDDAFDLVLSLDVIIVHGVDAAAAAREIHRVLKPGGQLIINVPAFGFLRGSHDIAVSIARRYTRAELAALLTDADFTIRNISYWNMALMPAVAVVRWLSRRTATQPQVRSDLAPVWSPMNALLSGLTRAELAASRRLPLPFGTSVYAVAQK